MKEESIVGLSQQSPSIIKTVTSVDSVWLYNFIWVLTFYSEVDYYIEVLDTKRIQLISLSKNS